MKDVPSSKVKLSSLADRIMLMRFVAVCRKLRAAQKEYMLNRGNDLLGQQVASAAKELDILLAEVKI